jgi:hypothetical protein
MGAPYPPAGEARQRADEILARPEFQPPEQTLLQRTLDWVDETVRSVLSTLLTGGAGSVVAWVVLGLLVVVVVVVASRVLRTVQAVPSHHVEHDVARARTARSWEHDAEACEREGRWKDGLRCRYRALTVALVERDLLRDVPGRTAGEFRRELREHAPAEAAAAFNRATDLFEAVWYGDRPTGADESATFRRLASDVLAEVKA